MSRVTTIVAFLGCLAACQGGAGARAPLIDANHYRLCENDALCPAGTHCQAGVCDADCRAAADCPAGESCDARGHCGNPLAIEPFAGKLSVSATRLDFSLAKVGSTLRVQNDGAQAIQHFHVVSEDPAVTAEPASGSLPPGEGADLAIAIQPGWTGRANLRVLSSGGTAITSVTAQRGLSGYLRGSVTVTGPFALGAADLALDLGPGLTGVIDGSQSLLWPSNAPVIATDDGTHATLQFTLVGDPGTPGNINYGAQVQRVVTLTGTHAGSGPLTGTYQEVISGFGPASVTVSGTFSLAPAGAVHGLVAAGISSFLAPVAPAALPASQCDGESSCPSGLSARGGYYFGLAFPFEQWAAGSSILNGECQLAANQPPSPCEKPEAELPALEAFAQSGSPSDAWEVFRAEASGALLQANDLIANVLEPAKAAYQGPQADAQQLVAALQLLASGLHANGGSGGLLAPGNLWRMQQIQPRSSVLDQAVDDTHRFGGIVRTELFAASQELDRLQRAGQPPSYDLLVAQRQATAGFLDAAALATVVLDGTLQSTAGAGTLLDAATQFVALSTAFTQVRQGLNPVGYPEGYIPFDYDPSNPSADLFQQMLANAQTFVATALSTEQQLATSDREFEQSSTALQGALQQVAITAQGEITELCGAAVDVTTGAGCGQGGRIGEDQQNITAAVLALEEAQVRSANDAQKLQMLQSQLQEQEQHQIVLMDAIAQDGSVIDSVAQAKAQEAYENQWWSCASQSASFVGSLVEGIGKLAVGDLSGIGTLLHGAGENTLQCEEAINDSGDPQRAELGAAAQTDITFQIQGQQNEIQDDAMALQVFDAQADGQASMIEAARQLALFNAAVTTLQSDVAVLAQDLATEQAQNEFQASHIDPTYRLYRDQNGMLWADEMQVARRWVFLATRGLDYMTNQTYSQEAQIFTAARAADLQAYLSGLQDAYGTDKLQNGWGQPAFDIISLRRDILGITQPLKDAVTGQTLTVEQQFQAYLALPKNRSPTGDLALGFNTNAAAGGVAFFSADVCEDRVVDLKVNVVSSALTGASGHVKLTQSGVAELADCASPGTASGYTLPTKTALVTAGLNLSRGGATDATYPASTDLFERPVLASDWLLSIDSQDPANAWLDLSKVEDLEIWVNHTARTVQGR